MGPAARRPPPPVSRPRHRARARPRPGPGGGDPQVHQGTGPPGGQPQFLETPPQRRRPPSRDPTESAASRRPRRPLRSPEPTASHTTEQRSSCGSARVGGGPRTGRDLPGATAPDGRTGGRAPSTVGGGGPEGHAGRRSTAPATGRIREGRDAPRAHGATAGALPTEPGPSRQDRGMPPNSPGCGEPAPPPHGPGRGGRRGARSRGMTCGGGGSSPVCTR